MSIGRFTSLSMVKSNIAFKYFFLKQEIYNEKTRGFTLIEIMIIVAIIGILASIALGYANKGDDNTPAQIEHYDKKSENCCG